MKAKAFLCISWVFVLMALGACQDEEKKDGTNDKVVSTNKLSLSKIAEEATVKVVSNYNLKVRDQNLWLSPTGEVTDQISDLPPYRYYGTGALFTNGSEYRILTAKHIVDASPEVFLSGNNTLLLALANLLIKNGWPKSELSDQEGNLDADKLTNLGTNLLEIQPCSVPGHIILPHTSVTRYIDDLNRNPRITPQKSIPFTRNQLGDSDFAIIEPEGRIQNHISPDRAFHLEHLARYNELTKIGNDPSGSGPIVTFGFPNQEDELFFEPQKGRGSIIRFDGEKLRLIFEKNVRQGNSGSVVLHGNSIIGVVSRYSGPEENSIIAVPIHVIEQRLRNSFTH